MNARATELGSVQGADEQRKEDVQESTTTADRSQQRSNRPKSTGGVSGSAAEQASAVRGSVNQYEIAVLYHPDLEIDLDKATAKLAKIIKDAGGKIVNTDNWGKRKLAYPIKKQEHAIYAFYTVDLAADQIQKIESLLNITDEVIRYLIVKPDLKAMAKAEKLRAERAAKAKERGDSPTGESEESKDESEEE